MTPRRVVMNEVLKMADAIALSGFVGRLNKFLYEPDFVTEATLTNDINRVSLETGLTAEQVQAVMDSTLRIIEERQAAAGVDSSRIGKGYAYGGYIVRRPGLLRRR